MAKVAMIDLRDNNDREEHYNFRTYVTRARLVKANGTADNQAIWRKTSGGSDANLAFKTMNEWLAAVETDRSNTAIEQKILAARPTLGVDSCLQDGVRVDASRCDAVYRTFTDTRVAAGEPTASDIMKCQLKPLKRADYPVTFTETEWASLERIFSSGVCDFSKPGVDQVTPEPWQTFADGPGGRPLPPPPAARVSR
jgi:hypothetical protein